MITVFNPGNYAQQVFLNEAYATLAAQGNILNKEELAAGQFFNLDSYFAHMKELVSLRPSYVLIPSDEEPFEIKANTREIEVPSSFSKCAGVVGDNMCEIITFTIDRYFDYIDLAKAHICVQWQLPLAPGETIPEQGVSFIGLRDLITTSGKIRFGWPLTKDLTKRPGNITFAVRFYMEKIEKDDEGNEVSRQMVYLFNTKSKTIPIVEGLSVNSETAFVEQGITDLFKEFVENSDNPSYEMPKPVSYVTNLPEQTKINENTDSAILKAQATTSGHGIISYKWYLKEGISDRTDNQAVAHLITENDKQFKIGNQYDTVDWSKAQSHKRYFIDDPSDSIDGKQPVIYKLVDGKNTFTTYDGKPVPEGTQLYEHYATLQIVPVPAEDADNEIYTKITGLYHVKAVNEVGQRDITVEHTTTDINGDEVTLSYKIDGINVTTPLPSNECCLTPPKDVVILEDKDLKKNVIINPTSKKADLTVVLSNDTGNPKRTFSWYKYDKNIILDANGEWVPQNKDIQPTLVETQTNKTAPAYDANTPGWYYVHVNSLLNRDSKTVTSSIARVVNEPQKPVIKTMEYALWDNKNNLQENASWKKVYDKAADSEEEQEIIVQNRDDFKNASVGDIISLKITLDSFDPAIDVNLLSDSLSYEWYVIRPNTEPQKIEATMLGKNSFIHESTQLNTNTLNIRCLDDTDNQEKTYQYYCKITNTLAGQSNSLDRNDYNDKTMFLIY